MNGQTIGAIITLAFVIIYNLAIPIYSAIKDLYLFPVILMVVTGVMLVLMLRALTKINRHTIPPTKPYPNKENQTQGEVNQVQEPVNQAQEPATQVREHAALKLLRALADR